MYIWGYQPHFNSSIEVSAEKIFNELKHGLSPQVWVVGVWADDNGIDNPNPVNIITIDTPFEPSLFDEINDIAVGIYENDPDRHKLISNELAEKKYHQRLRLKAKVTAMNKVLNEAYEGLNKTFYTSTPIKIRGFWTFVILQLNKEVAESIPSLSINLVEQYEVKRSLLESAISEFLSSCSKALHVPNAGDELNVLVRNDGEFIRSAGDTFLKTLSNKFHGHYFNLFEIFNLISSQYYEGGESTGRIIMALNEHPSVNQIMKFSSPISFSNHKAIRKLLEMTSGNISLIANGNEIYGMGNLTEYDSTREDVFIIDFKKHFTWELKHDTDVLMVVEYRQPRLPKERMDKELFWDHMVRTFSNIDEIDVDVVWGSIQAATEQKHGTMVVITNKAAEEAERLNGQCINIEPINLTSEVVRLVTAIDGAVLLDPHGKCHALGVILDGLATDKGDSARGARYNSAIRYLETQENDCLIVVVSEDGYINLIPYLKPRIHRQVIDNLVKQLEEVNASKEIDVKVFNYTMSTLEKLSFYLLQEDCKKVNDLRESIESKLESETIRIVYREFTPHSDMNTTYYK